jgi:hypothetical protein
MPVADTDSEPVEPQPAAMQSNGVPVINSDGEWQCSACTFVNDYTLFDIKCGCCADPSGLPEFPRPKRGKKR